MPSWISKFIWGNGAREWLDEFTAETDRREAALLTKHRGAHTSKQQKALQKKEKRKQKQKKNHSRRKPLGLKQE